METVPRLSGFREALPQRNDSSWSSRSHPPQYQPYPDDGSQAYTNNHAARSPHDSLSSPVIYPTISHRHSNKEASVPTEIASPGLESVWDGEGDKEVWVPHVDDIRPDDQPSSPPEPPKRRICGLRRELSYAIFALLILVLIALGVGLGVGFSTQNHSKLESSPSGSTSTPAPTSTADPTHQIGGALDPKYFTKNGAFNGSGIALASESFDGTTHGNLVMYFQHHTGQIRYQQLTDNGTWLGGDVSTIVAADAKNSTPLSAVAYALNGTSSWHLFYIDTNNTLRQKSNSNVTNVWVEGPLSAEKHVVYDADHVGMQACWYGNDYGDADYIHTPLPQSGDVSNDSVTAYHEVGMRMWYASNATTFEQLGWRSGDKDWSSEGSWTDKNTHAGVGCYSWGPGTATYVMMVNLQDTVEFWWKDTATNQTDSPRHPVNQWTNSSIAINNVHPSTSLGYTNVFYAQDEATSEIMGYNITWAAENTTISGTPFTVDGRLGLPGTHLSVTALPSESGGNNLLVFYQTEGDDVTEFTRDIVSGQWTDLAMSIPDL